MYLLYLIQIQLNKIFNTRIYMANSTNVNITVKITIYIPVFYKTTPKPTHHSKLSACFHFQSFCMFYKLVSLWRPKKYSHKVNLLVLLYFWDIWSP